MAQQRREEMTQPPDIPAEDAKMREGAIEQDNTSDVRFPAEELFGDVPPDKQDKNTADGDLSLDASNEEGQGKGGEIAARALDFPISTSHSPQTDNLGGN